MDKPLARLTKIKREDINTNIRSQTRARTTDPTDTEKMKKGILGTT